MQLLSIVRTGYERKRSHVLRANLAELLLTSDAFDELITLLDNAGALSFSEEAALAVAFFGRGNAGDSEHAGHAARRAFACAVNDQERAAALASLDPAEASTDAERAVAVFERLGARRYVARANTVLARLGARVKPARAYSRRSGPLSRRESEVAALVAEGLTNAEIAERLTVSVRTVTSHLDHIYTRLGINGRVALARHVSNQSGDLLAGR